MRRLLSWPPTAIRKMHITEKYIDPPPPPLLT